MNYYVLTALGIGFIFLLSTLGSALVYCFKGELSPKTNAAFLGLASGVMLAASVWSLLLPALSQSQNGWGRYAFIPVSVGFLSGALFLWLFDKCTPAARKQGVFFRAGKSQTIVLGGHLAQYSRKLGGGVCLRCGVGDRHTGGVFVCAWRGNRDWNTKLS